jgi:hypothetical protein
MLTLVAALAVTSLAAKDVPLPPPRPAVPEDAGIVSIETPHGSPTDCDRRLELTAVFEPKPTMAGPGACGGDDLVALSAVLLPDGRRVEMKPAATLRCEMAESLSAWVRDEVAPRLEKDGAPLAAIRQEDSYDCRNRNSASRGKVSEHAHGKAVDLRAFVLADKSTLTLTDVMASKDLRNAFHDTACRRFMTVLGPGEPYHDEHIHLDIIERRGGHRICSWAVREPAVQVAKAERAETAKADVPLPPPRPTAVGAAPDSNAGAPRQRRAALLEDERDGRRPAAKPLLPRDQKIAEYDDDPPPRRHHKRKRRP